VRSRVRLKPGRNGVRSARHFPNPDYLDPVFTQNVFSVLDCSRSALFARILNHGIQLRLSACWARCCHTVQTISFDAHRQCVAILCRGFHSRELIRNAGVSPVVGDSATTYGKQRANGVESRNILRTDPKSTLKNCRLNVVGSNASCLSWYSNRPADGPCGCAHTKPKLGGKKSLLHTTRTSESNSSETDVAEWCLDSLPNRAHRRQGLRRTERE